MDIHNWIMDIHKSGRIMDIYNIIMDIRNIIMDIHKSISDIHNSIMDIYNWIMDIHKWIAFMDIHKSKLWISIIRIVDIHKNSGYPLSFMDIHISNYGYP